MSYNNILVWSKDFSTGLLIAEYRGTKIYQSQIGFSFTPKALIWFSTEKQIIKFLTL